MKAFLDAPMSSRTATPASRRRVPPCVGLCAAFVLATPLAHAKCSIETLELPVRMVGTRAVATVGINGTEIPLTVDSGASFSMLTDAAAEQLRLPTKSAPNLRVEGITGRAEARITTVDTLSLLKGQVEHVQFIVGGNEPGGGTMGLMGRNLLALTDTEYDLAHGVIRFHFPNDDCAKTNMAYWAETTQPVNEFELLEDRSKRPAIRAKLKLNGSAAIALFDTGATTTITARAASRAGISETDLKPAGIVTGVGRGTSKAWTARFDRFEIGTEAISNSLLLVADFTFIDADLLLGVDYFLSHRVYISKKQTKMYTTYNGGPVFWLDRTATASAAATDAEAEALTTADQFARRGAASAARRAFESALADLDRACALEPTRAAYFAQRGGIQEALKRPAKALEDYDQALQLDETQADARLRRVALRMNAKDVDGAKADLDTLDRTLASQSQSRLVLATYYMRLDQPAQALVQLNQWLPAHPNEIGRHAALNQRCWARLRLGVELDRALDDCDDAVGADGTNVGYLDGRGWAYLRLGRYRKALSDFDRAIAAQPRSAFALYGRGLAKTKLGDAAQGDADLAAARKVQADIDARVTRLGLMAEAQAAGRS